MRKYVLIMLMALVVYTVGCGKKQGAEETQGAGAMSMDTLSTMNTASSPMTASSTTTTGTGITGQTLEQTQVSAVEEDISLADATLEPLPPGGPYRPTTQEIQTALKNAGFYLGNVDGKSGPLTKNAVEAFQKTNQLQADGKVGPKTWTLLSKYLSPVSVEPVKTKAKKR